MEKIAKVKNDRFQILKSADREKFNTSGLSSCSCGFELDRISLTRFCKVIKLGWNFSPCSSSWKSVTPVALKYEHGSADFSKYVYLLIQARYSHSLMITFWTISRRRVKFWTVEPSYRIGRSDEEPFTKDLGKSLLCKTWKIKLTGINRFSTICSPCKSGQNFPNIRSFEIFNIFLTGKWGGNRRREGHRDIL